LTKFDRAQLIAFIRAVDRHLVAKVEATIIGGAAATVGYGASTRTSDIDVFSMRGSVKALAAAAEDAREETGLGIAIGSAAVADLPYNYETRLKPIRGLALRKLTILIPDKYDLALSKTVRAYPHDIDAIESMNVNHRLARKTLVQRFEAELFNQAVADKRKLALNMAMVIARIHGFQEGKKLAERWGVPVPSRRRATASSRSRRLPARTLAVVVTREGRTYLDGAEVDEGTLQRRIPFTIRFELDD
jgi:hypothetical protein